MATSKTEAALHDKRIATILAVINMVLAVLAILIIFAPWLTAVIESGLFTGYAFDLSAWASATGFYSILGYTFTGEPALVYWILIIPLVACAILSIVGVISLYASGGKGKPTAILIEIAFVVVALFGLFEVYISDLAPQLGFIDLGGGDTATIVLGWGFIAEVLLEISLLAVSAAFWNMRRTEGAEAPTQAA